MNKTLMTLAAGLLMMAGGAASASVSLSVSPGTGAGLPGGADDAAQVAFGKIIRIGPRNPLANWRCAVTVNGNRYYSIGITEEGTRALLFAATGQYSYCRRDRGTLFFS